MPFRILFLYFIIFIYNKKKLKTKKKLLQTNTICSLLQSHLLELNIHTIKSIDSENSKNLILKANSEMILFMQIENRIQEGIRTLTIFQDCNQFDLCVL